MGPVMQWMPLSALLHAVHVSWEVGVNFHKLNLDSDKEE